MRKSKNRYFCHIFVSPGDAPGAIMLNVVWMEREYWCLQIVSQHVPSIFNSFPVIRTASAKNRHFHVPQPTFLFPLETPLRLSRTMLHGWKDNLMLAKRLVACICERELPSITEIFNDTDNIFFAGILKNSQHVLQTFLPDRRPTRLQKKLKERLKTW